jgi:hypothetical protein
LKAILLGSDSEQGVVTEAGSGTALVATARGSQRVAADLPVEVGDQVTVRSGRIVSKRTGGAGGAVKVYQV